MRNRFAKFNRYVMNIEIYRGILREINEDEDLNGRNVLPKVRKLEKQKYTDAVEWETTDFTIIAQRKNIYHGSLLHAAAAFGYIKAARALLEAGADIEAKCFRGFTPLHFAAKYGQTGSAMFLLAHNANIHAVDKKECTPLHLSAALGSPETVKVLLEAGAHVHVKDGLQNAPLHLAVSGVTEKNITETVRTLVNHGADVNAKDIFGKTPLHRTILKEDNTTVLEGHLTDCEINVKSRVRQIALLNKADSTEEVVELLLGHGAVVDARSDAGDTPLHCAVKFSTKKVINLLIQHGADVNAWDAGLHTPLHCVRSRNKISMLEGLDIAKTLVENGSDINSLEFFVRSGWFCLSKVAIMAFLLRDPEMNEPGYLQRQNTNLSRFWILASVAVKDERKKMSTTYVYNDITFSDILLSKNINMLASYMQNTNVLGVLKAEKYENDFPLHVQKIRNQCQKGIERLVLLNKGEESITKLLHICTGHYSIIPMRTAREIVCYLSNKDLRCLNGVAENISVKEVSKGAVYTPRLNIRRNPGQ